MANKKFYTLYKGDEILASGTVEEIAAKINVKPRTVHFYATPTYQKRSNKNNKGRVLVES